MKADKNLKLGVQDRQEAKVIECIVDETLRTNVNKNVKLITF